MLRAHGRLIVNSPSLRLARMSLARPAEYSGAEKAALLRSRKNREKRSGHVIVLISKILPGFILCPEVPRMSRALPIGSGALMPGLRIQVLGDFEARLSATLPLELPSRKSRALLAYLAVGGQRAHPRERLAALLWGEVPEELARQSLRKALWDLRKVLAGAKPSPLSMDGETVALVAETVDVLEFEALVRDGRPDALRNAMALYRGDLLEGFRVDEPAFEEWLTRERERFRRLSLEAHERLLAHETAAGRVEAAVEVALRLLLLNPPHEAAHRDLIRLYARQGRRDAALRDRKSV